MELTLGENSAMPKFREGGAESEITKSVLFLYQSIGNPKFDNIPRNKPSRSIRRADMSVYPHFDLEKYRFSSISQKFGMQIY